MSQSQSFPVDLLDREDVRAKLPRARAIGAEKEARAAATAKDVSQWRSFLQLLEERAELPTETEKTDAGGDGTDEVIDAETTTERRLTIDFSGVESVLEAVVRTVNEQNRPIRSRDVAELLRTSGRFDGVTNEAVSNALYYASERALPRRLEKLEKRGFYAPLSPTPVHAYVSQTRHVSDSAPARG
jgi:hypothetical protein